MKKSQLIAVTAVPLVIGGYFAATWVAGASVQASLDEQYKQLESMPYIKVVERKYDRTFFGATETVTFELMGDMIREMDKVREAQAEPADPAAPDATKKPTEPLRFTVNTVIKHGPLPGFSTIAAATADSELVLDERVMKELRPFLGDKKPLTAHSVLGFGGGGNTKLASPALAGTIPGEAERGGPTKVSWEGFTAEIDFSKGMKHYTVKGEAPGLKLTDDKGGAVTLASVKLDADQTRVFDEVPQFYSGTQRMSVAQLDVVPPKDKAGEGPVSFKDVKVDVAMPVNGEFIDISEKISAAVIQIGPKNYGPGALEISFRHLHARTTAQLHQELMKVYGKAGKAAEGEDPKQAMAALTKPAIELMKHNPEFHIDRVSFKAEQGEALVSASLKLKDPKEEDFNNPFMLIGKLDAAAELALPDALLATMAPGGGMELEEPTEEARKEAAAFKAQMVEQQLAGLAEQGYVTRANGMVKTKIAFQNGQLTANGKPFNPMGMAGGAPQIAPDELPTEPVPQRRR